MAFYFPNECESFFSNNLRREFFDAMKLVHIHNVIERFVSSFQFLWCLHAKFDMTRSILLVLSAWFECMYVWIYTSYTIWFDACIHMYMKLEPTRQTMAVNKILKQTASLRFLVFSEFSLALRVYFFFLLHQNSLFALIAPSTLSSYKEFNANKYLLIFFSISFIFRSLSLVLNVSAFKWIWLQC